MYLTSSPHRPSRICKLQTASPDNNMYGLGEWIYLVLATFDAEEYLSKVIFVSFDLIHIVSVLLITRQGVHLLPEAWSGM